MRIRKRRFFRGTLYIVLLALFFLSAYKVITVLLEANHEQRAFRMLSGLVIDSPSVPSQQIINEEPFPSVQSFVQEVATREEPRPTDPSIELEPIFYSGLLQNETAEVPAVVEVLPQYALLHETNPDFFGWVSIEGTVIDYPVMYTPDDPEYYIRRAFDGSYSSSGVPFLDGRCRSDGNYYLVYGHHMRNGTMFGLLPDYQDEAFYKEHQVICFDTLYEQRRYVVMAAFFSRIYDDREEGAFRYYEYTDISDPAVFSDYVLQVQAAALYDTGVDAEYGDELLVLSTCNYHTANGRFVVVAKRIR